MKEIIFKEINDKIKFNYENDIDGLDLLYSIKNEIISLTIFDPQYRGILEKMKYGNEGKSRQKGRCKLHQMSDEMIMQFIKEIERVTIPSGHLLLWIDKFHLCEGISSWFVGSKFHIVDMIVWDKDKMGMGYRTRKQSEYLVILQKEPKRAKGIWTKRNIRDVWREKILDRSHPHAKPINLQTELIETLTHINDIVLDPAAGGFSILKCCQKIDRIFLGTDLKDK